MAKTQIIHYDKYGIQICIGDSIIVAEGGYVNPPGRIVEGKVTKITAKGIKFKEDNSNWNRQVYYTKYCVIIKEGEFIPKTKCKCSKTT